jgi:RNase P subunit RPR2
MGSLKDALLKAGVKPTPETKDVKTINQREKIAKKKVTETVVHQEQRNFCENCEQVLPDVEFYDHFNPTTEAEWICVRCADRLQIADTCRRTAQSDTSIKKLFRREYGATASIPTGKSVTPQKSKAFNNGNR